MSSMRESRLCTSVFSRAFSARAAFSLALATPDGSREPLPIPHESIGIGSYAASVQLPAPGRWQLRVGFPEVTGVLEFDAGR